MAVRCLCTNVNYVDPFLRTKSVFPLFDQAEYLPKITHSFSPQHNQFTRNLPDPSFPQPARLCSRENGFRPGERGELEFFVRQ